MKNVIVFILVSIFIYSCTNNNDDVQNSNILEFTEVLTFQTDTLDIDLISNVSENSIYITHSNNSTNSESIIKHNLSSSSQEEITHYDLAASRQIEISGNYLYSIGIDQVLKMDLDLNNLEIVNTDYSIFFYPRAINYNDDIFVPYGINGLMTFNTSTNNYSGSLNDNLNMKQRSDGEIFNNKLYTFGGGYYLSNNWSDEIIIYDLISNSWTTENLPFHVFESFTDIYNDSIYLVGNKESDNTSAFIGSYDIDTNVYEELVTSLELNTISIRGVTVLNNEIFIAYTDISLPSSTNYTIKVVKSLIP